MKPGLHFSILGPVRAWHEDAEISLGSPQQRSTLAVLLLHAGNYVSVDQISDALWDAAVPRGAWGTIRTYIHRLRLLLEEVDCRILSQAKGYALMVDPASIDSNCFRRLARSAHEAQAAGRYREAVESSREALSLWRGDPLENLFGDSVAAERVGLRQVKNAVLEEFSSSHLALARDHDVIATMSTAIIEDPLHEKFHEFLMLALYRSGRQAEAISTYGDVRKVLRSELGVDPSSSLAKLYERILCADPTLEASTEGSGSRITLQLDIPEQIPANLSFFTGRNSEAASILEELDRGQESRQSARVVVISGMGGVGKTAFASLMANRIKRQYPDGQLHLNLHGFDAEGAQVSTAEAIDWLVESMGVSRRQMPQSAEERVALYHRLMTGRRVLLLLDNARDSAHVLPLIPPTASCLVLVTSRSQLTGLVSASDAHVVELRPFSRAEALELMHKKLGPERMRDEEAAGQIIDSCGGLPLAIAVACAKAMVNPRFSLAAIAKELQDSRARLNFLANDASSMDIRSVLASSYQALSEEAARLFRLLPLLPDGSIGAAAAAGLLGESVPRAQELLDELAAMRLLDERTPGRYGWHDLVHSYAGELLAAHETQSERDRRLRLVLGYYLRGAQEAARSFSQYNDMPATDAAERRSLSTYAEALDWCQGQHEAVIQLIDTAFRTGNDRYAWQLPWMIRHYLDWDGHWDDLRHVSAIALQAARRESSKVGMAYARRSLSRVAHNFRDLDEAERHLNLALELFEEEGDVMAVAYTRRQLAGVYQVTGEYEKAHAELCRAREVFAGQGHVLGEGGAMAGIAWVESRMRRYEDSLASAQRALSIFEEVGELREMTRVMDILGYANHHLGRYRPAADHRRRAAELHASLGILERRNSHAGSAVIASLLHVAENEMLLGDVEAAMRSAVETGRHLVRYLELHQAGCIVPGTSKEVSRLMRELNSLVERMSSYAEKDEEAERGERGEKDPGEHHLRALFSLAYRAEQLGVISHLTFEA
ncbi:AfsR/SARP family transcriptional regulator [Streptomyces sp. NBC_01483]|uniref:AfsR/SARP family transcriptional regulator n=1 Tax=Streptomyces sp. NBC_01483 TaxID=2903883 RepID=UPI002E36AF44|nr:BTAD domain-containing putative transcriptional regulator [Streptomyces sp. NBC_01483]